MDENKLFPAQCQVYCNKEQMEKTWMWGKQKSVSRAECGQPPEALSLRNEQKSVDTAEFSDMFWLPILD